MVNKVTTESFIEESNNKHNNFYSYEKTVYKKAYIKVTITCPIHGDFEQIPTSHKRGNGCPECGALRKSENRKIWTEESFREKVTKLHSNLIFDKTVYASAKEKVTYECQIHGEKETYPYNLLKGHGCGNCSATHPLIKKELWLSRFEKCECKEISYDSIPHKFNAEEKIVFVCKIHGEFEQTPIHHLKSCCPKCGFERSRDFHRKNPVGWGYTIWQEAGYRSKNFTSFKVYIIRCWNENEEFYKIGKTFLDIQNRFRKGGKSKMPYNYEVIKLIESKTDGLLISKLEKDFQKNNKCNKYIPKISFEGMNECFTKVILSKNPF